MRKTIDLGSSFPSLGFKSVRSLCHKLDISQADLDEIAATADTSYRRFLKPKKGKPGQFRTIEEPFPSLMAAQTRINERLLAPMLTMCSIAYGGIKKKSPKLAASLHVGQPFVACVDIRKFYPYVSNAHVYSLMANMGCSPDVARYLTRLTTRQGHLPQGTPTSTTIANLVLYDFDIRLMNYAAKHKVIVARFIDDIILSGNAASVCAVIEFCFRELNRMGFKVHRDQDGPNAKLRMQPASGKQEVLGLNINNYVSVPKRYVRQVRLALKKAKDQKLSNRERASLIGRVNYVASICDRPTQRILQEATLALAVRA